MYVNKYDLSRKIGIVTGGASGIGRMTTQMFLESGMQGVVIIDVNEKLGKQVESELGSRCKYVKADLTNLEELETAVKITEDIFGHPSAVVHCAAVCFPSPLTGPAEDFYRQISINVNGTFNLVKAVAPSMLKSEENGSIVLMSSVAGLFGSAGGGAAYHGSKFAVRGMAKAFACELAPKIRVNTVCPGPTKTPMNEFSRDLINKQTKEWPIPRMGIPEEQAGTICFLTSDAASFITGQDIPVDGGATCKLYPE
ncbi:MAG: SDR family oxidoreductase [Clostridiales bacterium]|nr:SDR family oxidoreductase [Clostridiales bacterium]